MEPVGLAVGIAGLAGLFSSCLEAVEKVQSYRSFGADSQVLDTQFKAEKLRFEQWGRHVGFDRGTSSADHHQALDDPDISSAVRDLLLIIDNICNANGASRRPRLAGTGLAQDELFRASQAQPSRTAPSESKRRKLASALGGYTAGTWTKLRGYNEMNNGSNGSDPGFVDIHDQVPVPISAVMLLAGSVPRDDGLFVYMSLCLIQARWIDADTWMMTNQPPVTRMQLGVPFIDGIDYLMKTSTANNVIKMDNTELHGAATTAVEDGARKSNFNTTYGEAWSFFYEHSIYCFPASVALHLTDGLASEAPMEYYNPYVPSFTPNYTIIKHTYHQHQYVYSFKGGITTTLAFAVLLLHAFIAILHTLFIALSGRPWYSSGWGSVGQLVALALRSRSAQSLNNVGGGVASSQVWKMRVFVKEVGEDGHLEMVLRDPEDPGLGRADDNLYEDYSVHASIPRLTAGKKYC